MIGGRGDSFDFDFDFGKGTSLEMDVGKSEDQMMLVYRRTIAGRRTAIARQGNEILIEGHIVWSRR